MEENDNLLSFIDLSIVLMEDGTHLHWNPITEFYNECHSTVDGRFCSGPGAGVSGRTVLSDPDGVPPKAEVPEKRGPRGGSTVDPNEGTDEFDGVKGYKDKKPVAGSDAWLEAHGISREVFEKRPYVKYEASTSDPALREAFPPGTAEWGPSQKAHDLFVKTAEQERQAGGYIMYKNAVPGTEHPPVAPQVRPNATIITDKGKWTRAKTILENAEARLDVLKKTSPEQLLKERKQAVKQAELNLKKAKTTTPEMARAETRKELEAAEVNLKKVKASTDDPTVIKEAIKERNTAKRNDERMAKRTDPSTPYGQNFQAAALESAELNLRGAQNRLKRSVENPTLALKNEIKDQEGIIKRNKNAFDKAAAKYLFTPGVSSARIDAHPDPQNIKNLTKGNGRIYLAMEGAIKNDAILTAIKKEDPKAAVVNVPSVTLWQQKSFAQGTPEDAVGEMIWFAQRYGKDRQIVLIPDADGVTNPSVMRQARALRTSLTQNGAGDVLLAIPPVKAGSKKLIDKFELPSGAGEKRKGIDDHLGGGRGTLGQLQYLAEPTLPKIDLSSYTGKAGKAKGERIQDGPAKDNAERVLHAIAGLVDPDTGSGQIPAKTMNQTAGFRDKQKSSALGARDSLEKAGIIKVEYVYDKKASQRGERILNPDMSEKRLKELISQGTIKQPHIYKKYTEVTYDLAPVITILKPEFRPQPAPIEKGGTLSMLPDWNPPKTFKGWTSPVTGRPDSTGTAKRLEDEHDKYVAKVQKKRAAATAAAGARTAAERLAAKKAPKGRRIVRSAAGAKKYGVPIGSLIPLAGETVSEVSEAPRFLTSMTLLSSVMTEDELSEFYNRCNDPETGKFCPGADGPGRVRDKAKGERVVGRLVDPFNPDAGKLKEVAKVKEGSVKVNGVKAKAVYELKGRSGKTHRLYDKTGNAGPYAKQLLENHARMGDLYPLDPPRDIVVTKPRGLLSNRKSPLSKRDFAIVNGGERFTFVNSDRLGFDVGQFSDGFQMPSAKKGNTKNMQYMMTHEYGHHVDFERNSTNGYNYKTHPLYKVNLVKSTLSRYGQSDSRGVEGFAEAFAEWHHSNGTTKNPAAIIYARYEGWSGANTDSRASNIASRYNSMASGQEDIDTDKIVSMTLQTSFQFAAGVEYFPEDTDEDIDADIPELLGITAVDNLDEDEGPKILGDFEVIEPTEAEIARAEKIVQKVMKELGLSPEGGQEATEESNG